MAADSNTSDGWSVEVLHSIHGVAPATWDTLVGDGCPFFEHAFLAAVEDAACVGPGTGWAPRHLLLRDTAAGGSAVAAVAAWEKRNSNAEFIFDWGWAEAAHRAGIPYYPKFLVAAPFSPVGGARIHTGAEADPDRLTRLRRAAVEATVDRARAEGHSGVHWLFTSEAEAGVLEDAGFALRESIQFHWTPDGERDFDGFLSRFTSKRRHQIRRERREVADAGVRIEVLTGDELDPSYGPLLWSLYTSTVDKFVWGQRYLNADFFERLLAGPWRRRLVLVLARRIDSGAVVGGAINAAKAGVMYGRYWGGLADVPFLHFEVCSYAGIEHCLSAGLTRFEAGAGGGEHKAGRGFQPVVTRSAHKLFHPGLHRAVAQFVTEERAALQAELTAWTWLKPAGG